MTFNSSLYQNNQIEESESSRYLEQGSFCKVTENIKRIAESIEGTGVEYLENVNSLMQENLKLKRDVSKRYQRDTDSILFNENGQLNREKGGEIHIQGCTESARVFRTLSLAKGIPSRLIETMSTDWINLKDKKYEENPRLYEGHVFVEVLLNGEWFVIDHMIDSKPKRENKSWIGKREDNRIKLGGGKEFEVVCTGIDHTDMITPEGYSISFKEEKDFHDFLEVRYPKRWEKITPFTHPADSRNSP
jgi:hypothetical protein